METGNQNGALGFLNGALDFLDRVNDTLGDAIETVGEVGAAVREGIEGVGSALGVGNALGAGGRGVGGSGDVIPQDVPVTNTKGLLFLAGIAALVFILSK